MASNIEENDKQSIDLDLSPKSYPEKTKYLLNKFAAAVDEEDNIYETGPAFVSEKKKKAKIIIFMYFFQFFYIFFLLILEKTMYNCKFTSN